MCDKPYLEKIKNIMIEFDQMLNKIKLLNQKYDQAISKYYIHSLNFDDNCKDIVLDYYKYIAEMTNTLYAFEPHLSSLSELIVFADSISDTKAIAMCGALLDEYEKFKCEISGFIKKCESEISRTKGTPSLNIMKRSFDEINRKYIFTHQRIYSFLNNFPS